MEDLDYELDINIYTVSISFIHLPIITFLSDEYQ